MNDDDFNIDLDFGDVEFDFTDDPPTDRRDSDELVAEAEARGEVTKIKSREKFIRYKKLHFQRLSNVKELLPLPKPGDQYRIITQESFNAYTFILYILERETIEHMHLSTFNIK